MPRDVDYEERLSGRGKGDNRAVRLYRRMCGQCVFIGKLNNQSDVQVTCDNDRGRTVDKIAVFPESDGPTSNSALPLYEDLLRDIRTVTAELSDGHTTAKELLFTD